MSGFGAYCPLPLRLGGSATEGWTAAQHARAVADRTAAVRAARFAWVTFTKVGAAITIHSVNSMPGMGLKFAPTIIVVGTGHVTLTWPSFFLDAYEIPEPVSLYHAKVQPHGATAIIGTGVLQMGRNIVDAYTFTDAGVAVDCKQTVRVS